MTAAQIPDEPPVRTTLTAPRMDHLYVRKEKGWYVASQLGNLLLPDAPAADWFPVVRILDSYGGILTVTTEYQIAYRLDAGLADEVKVQTGFVSREHIAGFRRWMADTYGVAEILRVQSQRVTRSAWTDEPLEDPT